MESLIYFEAQVGTLCGLHALNNALQQRVFEKSDLNEVARQLNENERSLSNTRYSYYDDFGNYNCSVLEYALIKFGYSVSESTHKINEMIHSNEPTIRLVTSSNHHIAVRKFVKNGPLYVPDSLLCAPIVDNSFWEKLKQKDKNDVHIYEISLSRHVCNNNNPSCANRKGMFFIRKS